MIHLSSLDDPRLAEYCRQSEWQAGAWLTIGSFDGVHKGHQAILRKLVAGARQSGAPAVVLTFHPHPSVVLRGRSGPVYLTSPDERAELLSELGVDVVITQTFTRELAGQSAREYVQQLSEAVGLRHLLIGHDFALGRNREGDLPALENLGKSFGFEVNIMRPVLIAGLVVSSSRIRAVLAEGDVRSARRLLGRSYRVRGPVISGDGRGRKIGIPTANLEIPAERILPKVGVYACLACVDGQTYKAVTNIGLRPTFTGGEAQPRLEAHLMDYHGDLYGKTIQMAFLSRLRDEMRFSGVEALVTQIQADIQRARRILKLT
jgi:riboflavin kinase / FMN adenylyltransferase